MQRVFDRPTPFTLRSALFKKATPDKLVAEVFIRDKGAGIPPVRYLAVQAFGGPRQPKSHEKHLKRLGLKPFWVPAPGYPLDRYGNIPGGQITKILSGVGANPDPQSNTPGVRRGRRGRGKKSKYFVLRDRRGALKAHTIYERIDSGFGSIVRPVLIGLSAPPTYRIRFNAFKLARKIFNQRFSINFRRFLLQRVKLD